MKHIALKYVWVCTYMPLTSSIIEGRGLWAYEFLEGGVYRCDSQSVNKKVSYLLTRTLPMTKPLRSMLNLLKS